VSLPLSFGEDWKTLLLVKQGICNSRRVLLRKVDRAIFGIRAEHSTNCFHSERRNSACGRSADDEHGRARDAHGAHQDLLDEKQGAQEMPRPLSYKTN
jgi:hypothetical protein